MSDLMTINPDNLDQEVLLHASKFLKAYEAFVVAERDYNKEKLDCEIAVALEEQQVRETLAASGVKATEKMVENALKSSTVYRDCETRLIDRRTRLNILKGVKDAYQVKTDMLQIFCRMKMREIEGLSSTMGKAA